MLNPACSAPDCYCYPIYCLLVQTDDKGLPTSKLAGDSLTVCEEIGSSAKTVEEAKEDPKV